jgi:H+/Cl- antiporter ClcA
MCPRLADVIVSGGRVPRPALTIDAFLQVVLVGSGASLGRESAPRQFAAALGDLGTGWLKRLPPRDRQILLACAAGAGLGAVAMFVWELARPPLWLLAVFLSAALSSYGLRLLIKGRRTPAPEA